MQATYSIGLARFSNPLALTHENVDKAVASSSNITLGSANDASYIGSPSINISSLFNYTYGLNNMSFGKIYYDSNNVAEKQYFAPFDGGFPVEFAVNF